MTLEETRKLLTTLRGAYPGYFRKMAPAEGQALLQTWADTLAECKADDATEAVRNWIASDAKGWPPFVGWVRERCGREEAAKAESMISAEDFAQYKQHVEKAILKSDEICARWAIERNQNRN